MNPDFLDMLSALYAEGAEFLVVGAHALAAHGHPRATGDLDIWVRPSADNAPRVHRALRRFGAPLRDLSVGDLTAPNTVFQIGVQPRRIDLLTSISGVEYEAAAADRVLIEVAGLTLPFISRHHLLVNKRAAGRPKDIADAILLESPDE